MSNFRNSSVVPRTKVRVPRYPRLLNAGFAVVVAACCHEAAEEGGLPYVWEDGAESRHEPDGGTSDSRSDGDMDVTHESDGAVGGSGGNQGSDWPGTGAASDGGLEPPYDELDGGVGGSGGDAGSDDPGDSYEAEPAVDPVPDAGK